MMDDYSEGQIAEFKEAFSLFDREGRGYITSNEILKIVNMFGTPASKDAIEKFMMDYDDDKNGNLDFSEFLKMMSRNNVF